MLAITALIFVTQQPKVSLEIRGERLAVAAPKIAQALGMEKLTVYAPLTNEVAAIRAVDVDPQSLKQRIEQAFHGTFIQKDGGWTLEQTLEQKAKERTVHFDHLTKGHQKFIDAAKKMVASAKPFSQAEATKLLDFREKMLKDDDYTEEMMAEGKKLRLLTPSSRFAVELVAKLSATHWRQVDVDDRRTVYSIRPTNTQLPMPLNLGDALANLISRQKIYSQIAIPRFKDQAESEDYEGSSSDIGELKMDDFAEINVILQDSYVTIMSYTAKGELKFRETITEDMLLPDETDPDTVEKKYAKLGPKLSPLADDYLKQIEGYYGDGDEMEAVKGTVEKPISAQLRAALMNPLQIDPLSIAVPEVLFGSNPKLNIVANVNEYMVTYRNLSVAFLEETPWWIGEHVVDNGWLTIGLPDAFDMRKSSIDRNRMAQVFQLFSAPNYPTIELQADYAREITMDDDEQNLCYLNLMLLIRGTKIESPAYAPFINLFGALSAQDRANARQRPISIGGLSQSFLWTLADCIVYQKHEGLYPRPKMEWDIEGGATPTPAQMDKFTKISEAYNTGFFTEPTYRHPNGLTQEMTLSIQEKQNFLIAVKLRSPINGRTEQTMAPTALGFNLFRKDYPSRYASAVKLVANYDLDSIKAVTYREVKLVVGTNPDWEYIITQQEPEVPGKQTYSATSLPPAIQKMVDDGYKLAKQAHEAGLSSGNERDVPPPF